MSSELTVVTFRHRDEARTVLEAIRAMRRSPILSLDSVVVVTKDQGIEIILCPRHESAADRQDRDAELQLSLAKMVFGMPSEGAINALTEHGIDGHFLREIARTMEDKSSALLFLTRESAGYDPAVLRSTLALFKGTVHQTSLSAEVEDYLSREWTPRTDRHH